MKVSGLLLAQNRASPEWRKDVHGSTAEKREGESMRQVAVASNSGARGRGVLT